MVKIKRDDRFVWPDRYYIWTYYPKEIRKSISTISKNKLYAKHITCIPYFSRQHAKHVVTFYHGKKALHYIHIISGKRLIKQGYTTFNKGSKKYKKGIFIKGKFRYVRQWAYPPEYQYDKHRRRYYIVRLNRAFEIGGKNYFNETYWKLNIGNQYRRISPTYRKFRYEKAQKALLVELEHGEVDNT